MATKIKKMEEKSQKRLSGIRGRLEICLKRVKDDVSYKKEKKLYLSLQVGILRLSSESAFIITTTNGLPCILLKYSS